jgi:hypothetical protein
MPDDWDAWDEWEFEVDDLLDHADLDEEELKAGLEGSEDDLDDWGSDDWGSDDWASPGWDANGAPDAREVGPDSSDPGPSHDGGVLTAPGHSGSPDGDAASAGSGGGGVPTSGGGHGGRESGMTWSAWDVGAAFAMGGWLLDQHAAQVGAQVRQALLDARADHSPDGSLPGAPHRAPSSGHRYGSETGTLEVGGPLLPGLVYAEARAASAAGRGLLVQAEGLSPAGGRLVLVVSVVPSTGSPELWAVAEERPDGFSAARLVPVFQRDPSGGLAVFATGPGELADAVVWACTRENVAPELLDVVRRA